MMDNLVFNLRQLQSSGSTSFLCCLGMDAADEIERLTAQLARLQRENADARNSALREAAGDIEILREQIEDNSPASRSSDVALAEAQRRILALITKEVQP